MTIVGLANYHQFLERVIPCLCKALSVSKRFFSCSYRAFIMPFNISPMNTEEVSGLCRHFLPSGDSFASGDN